MVSQSPNSTNFNNNSNPTVLTKKRVATGPVMINEQHIFNDADARNKMQALNNDIYVSTKKEERKPKRNYLKIILTSLAIVLSAVGIKKLYQIFKRK